jgi:hypothetical protein
MQMPDHAQSGRCTSPSYATITRTKAAAAVRIICAGVDLPRPDSTPCSMPILHHKQFYACHLAFRDLQCQSLPRGISDAGPATTNRHVLGLWRLARPASARLCPLEAAQATTNVSKQFAIVPTRLPAPPATAARWISMRLSCGLHEKQPDEQERDRRDTPHDANTHTIANCERRHCQRVRSKRYR